MKEVSCIIIGQGIAGTSLAWQLRERNISFVIIDPDSSFNASSVSSGLVNPITGRNYLKSWMVDSLMPSIKSVYGSIERETSMGFMKPMSILRALHDIGDENLWFSRGLTEEYASFIGDIVKEGDLYKHIQLGNTKLAEVKGGMCIDVAGLLGATRTIFEGEGRFLNVYCDIEQIKILQNGFEVEGVRSDHIIFAQGYRGLQNPYFSTENYRPALGEVLTVYMPDMEEDKIVKYNKFIVPRGEQIFWVGSNYLHGRSLSDDFTDELYSFLKENIRCSYQVIGESRGIRAATKCRRPFIDRHPIHSGMYIMNGLGTKGVTLAPYWAGHLIEHIYDGQVLSREVGFR